MPITSYPTQRPDLPPTGDSPSDEALERVMQEVPSGALALSALTVALMLLAWFFIFVFVFLPRGMVS